MFRHRHSFSSKDVSRVSAFSDAIFAIALTLPVLELRLPEGSAPLSPQLQAALPSVYAYLVTFAVGVTQWMSHYRLFEAAEMIDEQVLNRNNVFLFLFSLLPFTTSLVMTHGNEAIAIIIYALNVSALGLTLAWVTNRLLACNYLRQERLQSIQQRRSQSYAVSGVFALEAGLALVSHKWALWTPLLTPFVFRVVDFWLGRRQAEAH